MMKRIVIFALIVLFPVSLWAAKSRFDELDKPPEGAMKGQIFLGGILTVGGTIGTAVDAEDAFVSGSTYEIISGTLKYLWLSHLNFSVGISFEYMPIDHLGIKAKLKGDFVLQRTIFGAQYQNWSLNLYRGISLYVGPVGHLTTRKRWDITFSPVIGYSFGGFTAIPIASTLLPSNITGSNPEQQVHVFSVGAEINLAIYFSGGFYLSFGFDWNMFLVQLNTAYTLTNNNGGAKTYLPGLDRSFHNLSFQLGAGYAFSN